MSFEPDSIMEGQTSEAPAEVAAPIEEETLGAAVEEAL